MFASQFIIHYYVFVFVSMLLPFLFILYILASTAVFANDLFWNYMRFIYANASPLLFINID